MPIDIVTGAAASANVASLPANVILYSLPGRGKTTDTVSAFCRDGVCTAFAIPFEDGALKAPAARGYPVPDHPRETVKSWAALYETLAWLSQNRERYRALILDGLSVFSTYLYKAAEEQLKGKNKWDIPMLVRTQLLTLRQYMRDVGLHCVTTAHPIAPGFVDGVFLQGGFALSPKSLINEFFGQTDSVLRIDYALPSLPQLAPPNTPPPNPVRVYFTGGESWPAGFDQPADWRYWRTKNREGCASAIVPADLGAFLRGRQPPYGGL